MKQYIKDNKIIREGSAIELNGMKIINPTSGQYALAGYVEYVAPKVEIPTYVPTYAEKVEMLIRERYSVSDELALLRQRDSKTDEFAEYNAFCEGCKAKAKEE